MRSKYFPLGFLICFYFFTIDSYSEGLPPIRSVPLPDAARIESHYFFYDDAPAAWISPDEILIIGGDEYPSPSWMNNEPFGFTVKNYETYRGIETIISELLASFPLNPEIIRDRERLHSWLVFLNDIEIPYGDNDIQSRTWIIPQKGSFYLC
jgi:hypothetical protein